MKRMLSYIRNNYYAKLAIGLAIALLIGILLFIPLHKTVKQFEKEQNTKATANDIIEVGFIHEFEKLAKDNAIMANAQGTELVSTTTTEPESTLDSETTIETEATKETTTEAIEVEEEPEPEEITPEVEEDYEDYYDDYTCGLSESEFDLLCRIVYAENGADDIPDWVMQYTTEVIMNRVASSEFPNTVYGVVTETNPVQYETYWNGMADQTPSNRCIENVRYALMHEQLPDYIVGQSMSMWSGCIEYCKYVSHYGTEYFFYW